MADLKLDKIFWILAMPSQINVDAEAFSFVLISLRKTPELKNENRTHHRRKQRHRIWYC